MVEKNAWNGLEKIGVKGDPDMSGHRKLGGSNGVAKGLHVKMSKKKGAGDARVTIKKGSVTSPL